MGKGLIPADLETWKPRRRAIVPAFHKAYLEAMVRMFCKCTQRSLDKFERMASDGQVWNGEINRCPSNKVLLCVVQDICISIF